MHFSGNPPSVGWSSIFAVSKTLQKVMKITHFDALRRPFVNLDQASRRVPKIKQNVAKMHQKSPRNEHEKIWIPVSQWSKRTPSTDLRKTIETRYFCRSRCCFAHAMDEKIYQNRRKFTTKLPQKMRSSFLQW